MTIELLYYSVLDDDIEPWESYAEFYWLHDNYNDQSLNFSHYDIALIQSQEPVLSPESRRIFNHSQFALSS